MNDVLFDIQSLEKRYGKSTYALQGVTFSIRQGELTVILGSSGSGKTTLLNLLGGMDKADGGSIFFQGKDLTHLSKKALVAYRRDDIGFVYQSFNLIGDLTVKENILLQSAIVKGAMPVEEALRLVELEEKADSYPKELSGGQQQRVAIARALVKPQAILLCDEPTGALDYQTGKKILCLIEKLVKKEGRTVIFVTHTREIAKMADCVVHMRDGKVEKIERNETKVPASEIEW